MHSRIFQISENKIQTDDLVREIDFYDTFVGPVADYVSKIDDKESRQDSISWLSEYLDGVEFKGNSFTLTQEWLRERRENKIIKLKQLLQDLTCDNYAYTTYRIRETINEKYGFYRCDEVGYYETIDEFLDSYTGDEWDSKRFYIGSVFDYHF